jgi:hypothetical protein
MSAPAVVRQFRNGQSMVANLGESMGWRFT